VHNGRLRLRRWWRRAGNVFPLIVHVGYHAVARLGSQIVSREPF
jgi:hypothetical protein